MNARKIKRHRARLQNRREVYQTFDLGTGEYAGTYAVWNETRDRAVGVAEVGHQKQTPSHPDEGAAS